MGGTWNRDVLLTAIVWINIPADGLYEIDFQLYGFNIVDRQGNLTDIQEYDQNGNIQTVTKEVTLENMPIEFHIVRFNGEDGDENNISHELIYTGRYPNEQSSLTDDRGYDHLRAGLSGY